MIQGRLVNSPMREGMLSDLSLKDTANFNRNNLNSFEPDLNFQDNFYSRVDSQMSIGQDFDFLQRELNLNVDAFASLHGENLRSSSRKGRNRKSKRSSSGANKTISPKFMKNLRSKLNKNLIKTDDIVHLRQRHQNVMGQTNALAKQSVNLKEKNQKQKINNSNLIKPSHHMKEELYKLRFNYDNDETSGLHKRKLFSGIVTPDDVYELALENAEDV